MAHTTRLTVSTSAALLALTTLVSANDWPQWRGPLRDGISAETGLLKSWPAGGPPLSWTAKALGLAYSGVAVSAGKIYTLGDQKDGCYVVALDEKAGNQLWS